MAWKTDAEVIDGMTKQIMAMENGLSFVLDRVFRNCKKNPGHLPSGFFVPVIVIRRCSAITNKEYPPTRCDELITFEAYSSNDQRLRNVTCQPCADADDIPF